MRMKKGFVVPPSCRTAPGRTAALRATCWSLFRCGGRPAESVQPPPPPRREDPRRSPRHQQEHGEEPAVFRGTAAAAHAVSLRQFLSLSEARGREPTALSLTPHGVEFLKPSKRKNRQERRTRSPPTVTKAAWLANELTS